MGIENFGVNRSTLQSWASTRQAQSEFPRLIRRLIFETTSSSTEIGMPAGDGVAAGGWDGTVQATSTNPWVPDGKSVWELSVNKSPNQKADEDYSKRYSALDEGTPQDYVYIEAILRPWNDRKKWAAEKQKTGIWKGVKALGLDDIEAWLEQAPVTRAWLAELLGHSPYGYCSGEFWWKNWSEQTSPALTPELVLAGRKEAVNELAIDLRHENSVTTIAAPSIGEALAFLVAAAVHQDEQRRGKSLSQLAIVDGLGAWRRLVEFSTPLILVPRNKELIDEIPRNTHHRILIPVLSDAGAEIVIPPLSSKEASGILRGAGVDYDTANELGHLGRCSLTAMRRSIALNKALHRPGWADTEHPKRVRRLLLAGTWRDDNDEDRTIISELIGQDYEYFRDEVAPSISNTEDPFIMRTGGTWHIVSAVDSWIFLADHIADDDLKQLKSVVLRVLTEPNPALELPQEQRWMAGAYGKRRRFSNEMRRGLAQSLALLGTYGDSIILQNGLTGSEFANALVRLLFNQVSTDESHKGWKFISDVLPYLAEAGPEAFLEAVEDALLGDTPALASIFESDNSDGDIFSSNSEHVGLLWALENVSWAPEHFASAVELLAKLDEIDPGGQTANRPANSLAAIFRPWHPDTSVGVDRRLAVIDSLRRKHAEASWNLLSSMLPRAHGTHFPIYAPSFRMWKPEQVHVTGKEYREVTDAVVHRCIEDASEDAKRWTKLLEHYQSLHHDAQCNILEALTEIGERNLCTEEFRNIVWRKLNDLIGKHRSHPDSEWALPDSELDNLAQVKELFLPKSAVERWMSLFSTWDPYIGISVTDDFDRYLEELAWRRAEAINEVSDAEGINGVRKLACKAEVVGSVGGALAKAGLEYDDHMLEWLQDARGKLRENARSYFTGNYHLKGFAYFQKFLSMEELSDITKARLILLAIDDFESAWRWGDENPTVMAIYWSEFSIYGLGHDLEKVNEIGSALIQAKRPASAIKLLLVYSHLNRRHIGEDYIAILIRALEQLLTEQSGLAKRELDTYDLQRAFDQLESNRELVDIDKLIKLEWAYLRSLGTDAAVPTLYQWLSESPEAFVGVVSIAYKASLESPTAAGEVETQSIDEISQSRSSQAHSLLHAWNMPPGFVNGAMDKKTLDVWIDSVKIKLDECCRTERGMHVLGKVLFFAPEDPDGTWPGQVVRDVLEERRNPHIEDGFYFQVLNSRGVTSRGLDEGGKQEEELAKKHRGIAESFADEWPRVARLFRDISRTYELDARREEADAERHRSGLPW